MKVSISKIKEKLYTTGYYKDYYSELLEELTNHYGFQFIVKNGVVLKSDEKNYEFMVPHVTVDICKNGEEFEDNHTYKIFYNDFSVVNRIIALELKDILSWTQTGIKYIKAEYYLDYFKSDHRGLIFDKRVLAKTLELKFNEGILKPYMVYE